MGKSKIDSGLRYAGKVKWFNDAFGYGFIECIELCKEEDKGIYVHFSRIQSNEQFKTLSKGQLVTFEVVKSEKGNGLMAVNVREDKIIKTTATVVEMPNASQSSGA